jgi:hemolysin activation/secretion protein
MRGRARASLRWSALVALCSFTAIAAPPPPPDAGSLQRHSEQRLALPRAAPASPPAIAGPDGHGEATTFVVRRFRIDGATLLPRARLEQALDDCLNRPLVFADLEAALRRLVALYRQAGWHARVHLPEQDITEGTVIVQVLEGRFGELHIDAPEGLRARSAFLAGFIQRIARSGEPYRMDRLERGLLLLNDLPGVRADGVLNAGGQPGSTDLTLNLGDGPLLGGSLSLGNDGSRYTGRAQAIGRLVLDNPSGYGDQLSASLMHAPGLSYTGARYSLPLGNAGLRGSLSHTALDYRLGKEFAELDSRGSSRTRRAGLSYPLLRGSELNLELELAWAGRTQRDDSLEQALRRRRVSDITVSIYGDASDNLLAGGHTAWALDLVGGRARLDLDADMLADAAGPEVAGRFRLASVELRHDRWFNDRWRMRSRLLGQWSSRNLDSSQQFALGGPTGVRGYPSNEAGGDSGALLQLELHRSLPWTAGGRLGGFVFLDHGSVRQHHTSWGLASLSGGAPNRYALSAAGLGLAWTGTRGLSAELSLAQPLGSNPGGLDGRNQDGSPRRAQTWFNLRQRF